MRPHDYDDGAMMRSSIESSADQESSPTTAPSPQSFAEFWPHYVGAHRRPLCRACHYVGGVTAMAVLVRGVWTQDPWALLLAPVVGYGFAWSGHFLIEGNRPATFGHVWWSLLGEFKMLWLGLTGRMAHEVTRLFGSSAPPPDAPLLQQR